MEKHSLTCGYGLTVIHLQKKKLVPSDEILVHTQLL
jgi:hypothetical protein